MCIDGNTLDQLPEDGNLAQLRVIAIDSPTMDSPTSTASTSTSSSAPITSTSPDDVILTCNSSLIDEPYKGTLEEFINSTNEWIAQFDIDEAKTTIKFPDEDVRVL